MARFPSASPLVWWIQGAALGIVLALMFDDRNVPAGRLIVFGVTILAHGFLGELVFRRRRGGVRTQAALPDGLVPDGRIAIRAFVKERCKPNEVDDRFGRQVQRPPRSSGRTRLASEGLTGRVVVSTIFNSGEYSEWSDAEIARALRTVERSCRWIEREAIRWNAPLKLDVAGAYFVFPLRPFHEPEINLADQAHDLGLVAQGEWEWIFKGLNQGLPELGCDDFIDFVVSAESSLAPNDGVVWLLFPRQAGRSFALHRSDGLTGGANLAVCYALDANFPEPLRGSRPRVDPATIAHEMLHLFHATDKYGKRLDAFPEGTVTRSDIMRMANLRSFETHTIDLATAREIGWA